MFPLSTSATATATATSWGAGVMTVAEPHETTKGDGVPTGYEQAVRCLSPRQVTRSPQDGSTTFTQKRSVCPSGSAVCASLRSLRQGG